MEILENSMLLPSERNIESILALDGVLDPNKTQENQRDEIKNNVVAILGLNGNGQINCGSGLSLTSDGFVLTAHHVVKDYFPVWELVKPDCRLRDLGKIFFVIDKNGNRFALDPTFACYNEDSDLAVIKSIKPEMAKPRLYKLSEPLRAGEELSLIAPKSVDYQRGLELNETSSAISGFSYGRIFLKGSGKFGQSGSPYLSKNGELAGIHLGVNGLGSYVADQNQIARMLQSTVESLRQNYIDCTSYDPLSRIYIPFWVHDDHRAKAIENAKRRLEEVVQK